MKTTKVMRCMCVAVCAAALFACAASAEDAKPVLIAGFEPGEGKTVDTDGKPVVEHATQGTHALRLESSPAEYQGITIMDRKVLSQFTDYVLLRVDIFNPQDVPVRFGCRIDDAKSTSYGTRYNDDGCVAAPGRSTLEINLTGLTRSMARNFLQRDKLDVSQLKYVGMFMGPRKNTEVLYFDNLRLEGSGLPTVAGLRAFDFGPAKSAVYPGFEQVHEGMTWDADRGFGVVAPGRARRLFTPDDLGCDYVCAREFRVALPNGTYEVNLACDVMGEWGSYYRYNWRRLTLNGREVLNEKVEPDKFMAERYYRQEDAEDLPGVDVWEKFIAPINKVRRYTVEVTDGTLSVSLLADDPGGQTMTFLVVYPDAQRDAGRRWMDTLDAVRRERFRNAMAIGVPPKPEGVTPPARGRGLGYVLFTRHTSGDVPVTAVPTQAEIQSTLWTAAARGERAHAQLGIYAQANGKMTLRASDLKGPGGATIPREAVRVRKVRNFLKRLGPSSEGRILPYILQDFDTLDLTDGIARAVWFTVDVPDDATPGKYGMSIRLAVEGHPVTATIPMTLEVFPFKLERARSITLSVTGTTAAPWRGWFPGFEQKWWQQADLVMKDLADHGLNAVTGGPGATLKAVENGKPVIDYADMDRWLALAVKHGLTNTGDSYQGLAIRGVPLDMSRDCMKVNEQTSQKQFGVSYRDLIRIVYADVAQHAAENNWPPRVYYLLDEPRPEYGNVEPAIELTKLYTAAAPGTLFSGYYSLGGGRDPLFAEMPVSIAHFGPKALEIVKQSGRELWDYDGNRVRHNIGRWAYKASKAGLTGYLRNGYMYVCCNPYFDFSEDEGSWSCVYPSKRGINATVGWERTGQGAADFAYMEMLEKLIAKARAAGKAKTEADAAEAYLKETLAPIDLDNRASADLDPAGWDAFRRTLAAHIAALHKTLGE